MKGIYSILDCCFEFINDIDDFASVEIATDFSCYPNTNEIYIAVIASQIAVNEFMDNLYARTKVRDISEFTWSLLHEVGHCETWYMMNERTINHCEHLKRKIRRGSLKSDTYYTLTDERIATDWAIHFVERNHEYVKEFDRQILKLLDKFYLENEVENA